MNKVLVVSALVLALGVATLSPFTNSGNFAFAEDEVVTVEPQLSTDKTEYQIGQTVTIFGKYFEALQNIVLKIFGYDDSGNSYTEEVQNITTDAQGAFTTTYVIDDILRSIYTVVASALDGTQLAQTTFADPVGYNKGVYNKGTTSPSDTTGVWTTGNAGSNYLENQWAYYQYQVSGINSGSVPDFDVTFNHYQSSSGAVFIDAFANFRACLDCTENSFTSGPKQGMLLDGVPYPSTSLTNWKNVSSAISKINNPFTGGTCQSTDDPVNTPSADHCFSVDGSTLGSLVGLPATGNHTITLFYEAHLAASSVWTTGNEGSLGTPGPYYVSPGPEVINGPFGTEAYTGWTTSSILGVGSATGSSRHFAIENQTAGSNGGLTLPIPTVPAPTATLTIIKDAQPNDAQDFAFDAGTLGTFNLDDDADGTLSNTEVFTFLAAGTYLVSETVPVGWVQSSATCSDGSPVNAIALGDGETVTCTFINTLATGHIIVDKVTLPAGDPQSFSFDAVGGTYADFALADATAPNNQELNSGNYSVSETVPAGWTQTSAVCVSSIGDTETVGALELDAGETITCTFTNTKKGHIIVDKITDPVADLQSFNFTAGGVGYSNFALTDATAPNNQEVVPGAYSVSETVPAGWDQTSAVCDQGETIASLDVEPGETVTCTFTNTKKGHIILEKQTIPNGMQQVFDFDMNFGDNDADLSDGQTEDNEVVPGIYSASENVPAGWDLTSAVCSDQSPANAINVAPGETVTCVFTNTLRGRIIIEKQTIPNAAVGSFGFTGEIVASLSDGQTSEKEVVLGTYYVAETVPSGWNLTSIVCNDNDSTGLLAESEATFIVAPGEVVTCVFTNTKKGHIIVDKVTDPVGDPQSFSFDAFGGAYADFNLTDVAAPNDQELVPGNYNVAESVPQGWDLIDTTCVSSIGDTETAAALELDPAETITCTFTNQKDAFIIVDKVTFPAADPQSFSFTTGGAGYAGFALTDVAAPNNSGDLTPGNYSVAETVPAGWDLTSATCDDQSPIGAISLQAGETVTCTFTNTKRGHIIIVKNAIPNDAQDFTFNNNFGNGNPATFDLDDDANGTLSDTRDSEVLPGTYNVSEDPVVGWQSPESTECSDGSPVNAIEVSPGETVTCTFVNEKLAKIILVKNTIGGDTSFDFVMTGTGLPAGTQLTTVAGTDSETFENLDPDNEYTITETPIPAGWAMTSAVCTGTNTPSSITPNAGEVVTCTFTNNKPAAQIDLTPLSAFNEIGDNHVVTANVQIHNGDGVWGPADNGTLVTFSLLNNTAGAVFVGGNTCVTAAGSCSVTINSATTGSVDIHASSDPVKLGVAVHVESDGLGQNSVDAEKTYVNAKISIDPQQATNKVGDNHLLTATVMEDKGDGAGFVVAVGETVTFTVTTGTATFVGGIDTCITDGSGQCSVSIVSTLTGSNTIEAEVDADVMGVIVHRETDGTNGSTGPADKDYVNARISITQTATNEVDDAHIFTVTVEQSVANGVWTPVQSAIVDVDVNPAPGSLDETDCAAGTDVLGQCTATINSAVAGVFTANASTSILVNTVAFNLTTDGVVPNSGPAVKTYVDASISLTPQTGTNNVGEEHEIITTVTKNDGNGSDPAVGATVTFTVNPGTATFVGNDNDCVTNGSGQCSVFINDNSPGANTINATTTFTVLGVSLTRATNGDSGPDGSDAAEKQYIAGKIIVQKVTVGGDGEFNFNTDYKADFQLSNGESDDSGWIVTGNHSVNEDVLAGWDLTSVVCNSSLGGTEDNTSISLTDTEVVTCTFTNTKRGEIVLVKNTIGGDGSFDFVHQVTGLDATLTTVLGTDSDTSSKLVPGDYSISETVPAGWDLTSATCDQGETIENITVGAGEIVTCTFTNTKRGHIIVDKVTLPAADAQSFSFTTSGVGYNGFALTDVAAPNDQEVVPGTYSVSETVPAGWDLTSATCDQGETIASLDVEPGETVTCTFTNTKRGHIILEKQTLPNGSGQVFDFDMNFGDNDADLSDGQTEDNEVVPGTYSASENVPAGWDQTSAVCSDQSPVNAINVAPGETVTCTFTNTKRGHIIVDKVTLPAADAQSFSFTTSGVGYNGFALTDVAAPNDQEVVPGTYSVSETVPAGWDLTSATCDQGETIASLDVEPGETVTCTFTNTKRGKITIVKDADPQDCQDFTFAMTGQSNFLLDDNAGVQDCLDTDKPQSAVFDNLISNQNYTITETLPNQFWKLDSVTCVNTIGGAPYAVNPTTNGVIIPLTPGADVTCTFQNDKITPTRTQGFWQTHKTYTTSVFNSPANIFPWFSVNNMIVGSGVVGGSQDPLDTIGKVFGGFWSNIAKKSTGQQRSALDKARMQLAQQLIAAELNCAAFGCTSLIQTMIATANTNYAGTNISAILASASALDGYNNSGDTIIVGPTGKADPKGAKAAASYTFWDTP